MTEGLCGEGGKKLKVDNDIKLPVLENSSEISKENVAMKKKKLRG